MTVANTRSRDGRTNVENTEDPNTHLDQVLNDL